MTKFILGVVPDSLFEKFSAPVAERPPALKAYGIDSSFFFSAAIVFSDR
jgi:hypothetical protein